jgi:hypothetical protein
VARDIFRLPVPIEYRGQAPGCHDKEAGVTDRILRTNFGIT